MTRMFTSLDPILEKHNMKPGHNNMKLLLPMVVLIWLTIPSTGSATENDFGTWTTFSTTDAFQTDGQDSRWHYWFDAQARYFDLGSGINQWLVRPAIGYEFRNSVKGWAGYARFRTRNRVGSVADENRYWQQIEWPAVDWNGGRVAMRVRLEQRSISTGDDIGLVARFRANYVRPVGEKGDTSLVVAIEPFFDLRDTDWGGDDGLGQNRVSILLGRRLSDSVSIEAGYMNQYIWADSGENRINHFGVLNFKVRL